MKRLGGILVLVTLCGAAPAQAALVEMVVVGTLPAEPGNRYYPEPTPPRDRLELRITADAGNADDIRVDSLRVTATTPLRAGARCRSDAPGSIVCDPGGTPTRGAFLQRHRIDLGDGDDRLAMATGMLGDDPVVLGGAGADVLDTTGSVAGSLGLWDGGPGPDRIEGPAPGWTIDYSARTEAVSVSLDGVANDGAPGEGDDTGPIHRVRGGAGDDTLVAAPEGALLHGGPGADRIFGGPGGDRLYGEEGDDQLAGDAGDDELIGGTGADRAEGGDGDDRLPLDVPGDGAPDTTAGGPGTDLVVSEEPELRQTRIAVALGDGVGPGGPVGERDTLTGAENLRARGPTFTVTGGDGPNRIDLVGDGTVDGRGGDDVLTVNDGGAGDARVIGGPGADLLFLGFRGSAELRDGETDRIVCGGTNLRRLRVDPGIDFVRGCFRPVVVREAEWSRLRTSRVRAGSRVPFEAWCNNSFHPCRARLFPKLIRRPGRRVGTHLPALGIRLRADQRRRFWVRVPAGARPGRWYMRFGIRTASPYAGVPPSRGWDVLPFRVVRGR